MAYTSSKNRKVTEKIVYEILDERYGELWTKEEWMTFIFHEIAKAFEGEDDGLQP